MADPNNDGPSNPATPQPAAPSTNGSGTAAVPNGAAGPAMSRPTVEPTVAVRRERYMVASRKLPGVQPMAADVIASTLTNMGGVTIVKRITPRGFGAFSTLSAGPSVATTTEIVVAEMDPAQGAQLRASAPPHVVVERDSLLRHADDFGLADFNNAMTMMPGIGVDIPLRVVGAGGKPLPKSTVYVYGMGFPAQGVTDDKGEVTVTLFGGTIETVQAIYAKPAADHWDRMFMRPQLQPNGISTLQLHPLSDMFNGFPQTGMTGWGQHLMKLDQIDPSFTGQGVKIGIVDSGCDNTHPQLTHVTHGVDLTNNADKASWIKDTMSHGTHCAGIITGALGRSGIRGFAPGAEVHALKVFPGGRFSDLIDALDQCIDRQLDIVNLSLGSSESSELVAQKLIEVRQHGVACIVAAGNTSGPVQFPGTQPSVLTVAAIGQLNQYLPDSYHAQTVQQGLVAGEMFSAKFTCFGPQVAVAGPGVAIVSTVPGGGYAAWDGTSMATPHITGMGALLLAHHPLLRGSVQARNEQRVAQLFALLANTGVRYLGDPTREGAGLPDLQRAGLNAAPQAGVQTASAGPQPSNAIGNIGRFQTFDAGPQFGAQGFPGNVPFVAAGGIAPSFNGFTNIDPATFQRLVQLRAAGLL
jgi:subtilisin family serine protease